MIPYDIGGVIGVQTTHVQYCLGGYSNRPLSLYPGILLFFPIGCDVLIQPTFASEGEIRVIS